MDQLAAAVMQRNSWQQVRQQGWLQQRLGAEDDDAAAAGCLEETKQLRQEVMMQLQLAAAR